MTIELTQLDNGLRVATEAMPGARSVALAAFVGVGSRDESSEAGGASHFLEHLLFKGGGDRSARDIAEAVDGVGGELNAYTSRETTAFIARLPADAIALGADLLRDVVVDPRFGDSDVDTERQVILDELRLSDEVPEERAHRLLQAELFPHHPLGREILGSPDTISAHSAASIGEFHDQHYRPERIIVVAAGAIDHDWLVDHAAGWFSPAEPRIALDRGRPEPLVGGVFTEADDGEEVHLLRAWRSLSGGHDRRHLAHITGHLLGGGPASRLFQSIREERGLAYSVFASISGFTDCGALMIGSSAAADRFDELAGAVDHELGRFASAGVSAHELATAKGYLAGALVIDLEDPGSRMMQIGASLLLRNRTPDLDAYLASVDATTVDELNDFIAELFGEPAVTAVVGPID